MIIEDRFKDFINLSELYNFQVHSFYYGGIAKHFTYGIYLQVKEENLYEVLNLTLNNADIKNFKLNKSRGFNLYLKFYEVIDYE